MSNYSLFSPVGKTDPVTDFHDGSLIHICRVYKPRRVYLYLSSEMLYMHQLDDRYRKSLWWLQEQAGFQCEIFIIDRPNLVDVHIFDNFYDDFEQALQRIAGDNPEATILLNISSGTPAMKSALQFIAASAETRYLPIQVASPQKGANREKYDFEVYELPTKWELNADNMENFQNRCMESPSINLNKRIKQQIIVKHLSAYDYQAALRVAQPIATQFPEDTMLMLRGAADRLNLNINSAVQCFKQAQQDFLPVKSSDKCLLFEYVLWLQLKQKRGDLSDFTRGLTPIIADLFEIALKEKCGIDIQKYCMRMKNKDGTEKPPRLIRKKLEDQPEILEALDANYKPHYQDSALSSDQMALIIETTSSDQGLTRLSKEIRDIESVVRNLAAHEIVSVTEKWLISMVDHSSAQILALLTSLLQLLMPGIRKEFWQSYELMNEAIIASFTHEKIY